jgi:tRNA/tmRNA/rRNA uracil-C5-methylase (TrmA/RlmC/RlmD family)
VSDTPLHDDDDSDSDIVEVGPAAHGGHCVARANGRVIFVRHTLPGERVRIRVTERKKSYWRADAVEVLRASPDRVTPPCRFSGPGLCGGCDFQHVSAAGQLAMKSAILREQLVRMGGMSEEQVSDFQVEPLPGGLLGWRTRMQYAVTRDGRPGLRVHRSHDVVHIDTCVIADRRVSEQSVLQRNWKGSNVVAVAAGDQDEPSVYTQRDRRGGTRLVSGPARAEQIVSGHWFALDADAFWQVHADAADVLAAKVTEMLRPADGDTVWDLYAGAGLFAAVLADEVGSRGTVVAVETDRGGNAVGNLADLPQARVHYGDVAAALPQLPSADIVVLDPPRSGAGADIVDGITAVRPRAVAYVACDPSALARDLLRFHTNGYRLAQLSAYDAFPMTQHFETIALLEPIES